MSCHKGGLPTLRHNEIRDLTADLVSPNVAIEPILQTLDIENLKFKSANHEDEARLDTRATGFWRQEAFFDVQVFYPCASSYRNKRLADLYPSHEAAKKREYGEKVREVERGVFTPLVLSTSGGMARECTVFFKRIADLLSVKKRVPY